MSHRKIASAAHVPDHGTSAAKTPIFGDRRGLSQRTTRAAFTPLPTSYAAEAPSDRTATRVAAIRADLARLAICDSRRAERHTVELEHDRRRGKTLRAELAQLLGLPLAAADGEPWAGLH